MTIFTIMGVAGSGKSTIGRWLARALSLPFVEGDAFHPPHNRARMAAGVPLTSEDRRPWIEAITTACNQLEGSCVLACSALDPTVRGWLVEGVRDECVLIVLEAPRALLEARLRARTGHFFGPELLDSQLAAFDPPADALTFAADDEPGVIGERIVRALRERGWVGA
jgi:gluconokinase